MLRKALNQTLKGVAVIGLALAAGQVMANEPIRIGSFLSATGPASFLGDPELKTLEHWVAKINAEGGVLGRKLELVHYDDGGSAAKARSFAQRLLTSDKVDIIVGGSTTGTTMAVAPLVERYATPMISLAGGIVITEPVQPWLFKTPATDRMAARKIFEDMRSRGITKIGLISGTGGFGKSGRGQSHKVAAEYGIEIVADETYAPTDTNMSTQLIKIKNTEGVQAILNFGFGSSPAVVTRNHADLGIGLPLYQSHGVASKKYIELAGDAANGVRLPAGALTVARLLPENDPQRDVVLSYLGEYEKAYKEPVSTFGGYAYDGLMLAITAIERAGSTDKRAVRDALEKIGGLVGVSGTYTMSDKDHTGLTLDAFYMVEIKDGDWSLVR